MTYARAGWLVSRLGSSPPPRMLARHHQDYCSSCRESQPKPAFATGILVGGLDASLTTLIQKQPSINRMGIY